MSKRNIVIDVVKRNGRKVDFDGTKILVAISKGFYSVDNNKYNESDISKVYNCVLDTIENNYVKQNIDKIKIEEIQDIVESELKANKYMDVYHSFSDYRKRRSESREIFNDDKHLHKFIKTIEELSNNSFDDIDTDSSSLYNNLASTVSSEFAKSYLIKSKELDLIEEGYIYMDYIDKYLLATPNSISIRLSDYLEDDLLDNYLTKAFNLIIELSRECNKEIAITDFDIDLANPLLFSYKYNLKNTIASILEYSGFSEFIRLDSLEKVVEKMDSINSTYKDFSPYIKNKYLENLFKIAIENTRDNLAAFIVNSFNNFFSNLNSLNNIDISINIGSSISAESLYITNYYLEYLSKGVEYNNISTIFRVTNYNSLLDKAIDLIDKSNIYFAFVNNNFNKIDSDIVTYFKSGTRIIENSLDDSRRVNSKRGELARAAINLPRLALISKNNKALFQKLLLETVEEARMLILDRFEYMGSKRAANLNIIKNGIWLDSSRLKGEDKIRRVLKHGNLTIGLVGLKECLDLIKLDKSELISIFSKLSNTLKEYSTRYNVNFYLAESDSEASLDFVSLDKSLYANNLACGNYYSRGISLDNLDLSSRLDIEGTLHSYLEGGHTFNITIDRQLSTQEKIDILKKMEANKIGLVKISYKE